MAADEVLGEGVEVGGADAGPDAVVEGVEEGGDDGAGAGDGLDVGGRLQHGHAGFSMAAMAAWTASTGWSPSMYFTGVPLRS